MVVYLQPLSYLHNSQFDCCQVKKATLVTDYWLHAGCLSSMVFNGAAWRSSGELKVHYLREANEMVGLDQWNEDKWKIIGCAFHKSVLGFNKLCICIMQGGDLQDFCLEIGKCWAKGQFSHTHTHIFIYIHTCRYIMYNTHYICIFMYIYNFCIITVNSWFTCTLLEHTVGRV